jgi:hypothetical protein
VVTKTSRQGFDAAGNPVQMLTVRQVAVSFWDRARMMFPGAQGVLDIHPGIEHVSDMSKQLYGEDTPETKAWTDDSRTALLHGGLPHLELQIAAAEPASASLCQALSATQSGRSPRLRRPAPGPSELPTAIGRGTLDRQ